MPKHTARFPIVALTVAFAAPAVLGTGCESRADRLAANMKYDETGKKKGNPARDIKPVPPHPVQTQLDPLLKKIFSGTKLPGVLDSEEPVEGDYHMSAGVLAKVHLKPGISTDKVIRAIVHGTAEADAWVPRDGARRSYGEQVEKVRISFKDEKDKILGAYGDLKLLAVFNDSEIDAVIDALPGEVKGEVLKMKQEYTEQADARWDEWMGVKMYARRAVAGDEPFKSLLRDLRKNLGKQEPKPVAWENAHGPEFEDWAKEINGNDELFAMLTNLRELKDQEQFRGDTHAMWVVQGSPQVPDKAKKVKIDPDLGFGVHREDLGGGFQEMTFVFSKKEKDRKKAYLQSHIYRHLFSDFQLLATAGNDFKEGIVPDKYDPEYAYCASGAAIDSMILGYASEFPILQGVKPDTENPEKILTAAHECIIQRCSPDIKNPDPDDESDVEGPAPGSRLGFFQMLARFEKVDVDMDQMRKEEVKSDAVLEAEALLKANKNKPN
jgi:hypothetical protein